MVLKGFPFDDMSAGVPHVWTDGLIIKLTIVVDSAGYIDMQCLILVILITIVLCLIMCFKFK